jgi:hypothetical protein
MLLLQISAATANRRQGVQVVITDTSLSDISLYQYCVFASVTLFILDDGLFLSPFCVCPDTDTLFTYFVAH